MDPSIQNRGPTKKQKMRLVSFSFFQPNVVYPQKTVGEIDSSTVFSGRIHHHSARRPPRGQAWNAGAVRKPAPPDRVWSRILPSRPVHPTLFDPPRARPLPPNRPKNSPHPHFRLAFLPGIPFKSHDSRGGFHPPLRATRCTAHPRPASDRATRLSDAPCPVQPPPPLSRTPAPLFRHPALLFRHPARCRACQKRSRRVQKRSRRPRQRGRRLLWPIKCAKMAHFSTW